ncbi:unnamed protein product [Parnassius mnemosyne]|uniref:Uncharacterized protein n=1 Tax=Parnassius mnemosyne TaxID=213953 RepID=A0AAV1KVF8_9NEOP
MLTKIFGIFALLALAMAAPKPEPSPQVISYTAGFDYVYPGSSAAVISPYSVPYTYSALPYGTVYLR